MPGEATAEVQGDPPWGGWLLLLSVAAPQE